jgi:xanthine phosphoribosyltransferase
VRMHAFMGPPSAAAALLSGSWTAGAAAPRTAAVRHAVQKQTGTRLTRAARGSQRPGGHCSDRVNGASRATSPQAAAEAPAAPAEANEDSDRIDSNPKERPDGARASAATEGDPVVSSRGRDIWPSSMENGDVASRVDRDNVSADRHVEDVVGDTIMNGNGVRQSRGGTTTGVGMTSPETETAVDDSTTSDDEDILQDVSSMLRSSALAEYGEQRAAGLIPRRDLSSNSEYSDAWALAVRSSKAFELRNQYSRVGIQLDINFPDFKPAIDCEAQLEAATLENISLAKARMVYEITGLPAIAETHEMIIEAPESGSRVNKTMQQSYKTRNVFDDADAMIDRVRPISDDNRLTRFRCVVAYYDGEMEIFTRGVTEVAIIFSASRFVTVAISSALDQLYMELTRILRLTLVSPGSTSSREAEENGEKTKLVGATLLRERIMREGEMLDNSIIKVSSFLNHKVDAELMESCGEELAERLRRTSPTKVLTVESTGLIPGLPTARKLGIPLVFARKSRPITVSDSFQTTYRSATRGTSNELVVSCEYLTSSDRVVIIDDFLAGGSTAEALFKLARMAHAKVVGVGVLIEKITDGGRAFLSGYDVPVESLAKVLPSSDTGRVEVLEEKPWVSPEELVGEQVEITSTRLRVARQTAARRARGLDRDTNGIPGDIAADSVGTVLSKRPVPMTMDSSVSDDNVDVDSDIEQDGAGFSAQDERLDDVDDLDMIGLDDDDDEDDEYDQIQDSLD